MIRTRLAARGIAAAILLGSFFTVGAPAAEARTSLQVTRLTRLHNLARHEVGDHLLRFNITLSTIARRHSLQMAGQGRLYHSSDLTRRVSNWRYLGENVGVGPSIEDLQDAFMGSPPHRRNILKNAYDDVGVGIVKDSNGTYWVTVVFRG